MSGVAISLPGAWVPAAEPWTPSSHSSSGLIQSGSSLSLRSADVMKSSWSRLTLRDLVIEKSSYAVNEESDDLTGWDPMVAVLGHIPFRAPPCRVGRLARASALLLMYKSMIQQNEFIGNREWAPGLDIFRATIWSFSVYDQHFANSRGQFDEYLVCQRHQTSGFCRRYRHALGSRP
jgi:hypothetical protein